jgi:hypothetical protein
MPPGTPGHWPAAAAGPGATVWLERDEAPHANDAMILERLALAAATVLGVHHSTVQSRLTGAATALGYDPRTAGGRTRYVLARTLQRLRNAPPLLSGCHDADACLTAASRTDSGSQPSCDQRIFPDAEVRVNQGWSCTW